MGRANEFKNQPRDQQANASKSVHDAMKLYSNGGQTNLRKHNFAFGFEDNKRNQNDVVVKTAVAAQKLYDYTKSSQEGGAQRIKDQLTKNRVSNISWGLKAHENGHASNEKIKLDSMA